MKAICYIVQKKDFQSLTSQGNIGEVELEAKVNKFLIETFLKNKKGEIYGNNKEQ